MSTIPSSPETTPGSALRPHEVLSSAQPLVLVRGADHGQEIVPPGHYACIGNLPCADTDYYLLVRWEHRESGRQGARRVVLPEHIRVLEDPAVVLPLSLCTPSATPGAAPGPAAAVAEESISLVSEATARANGPGQPNTERYPQLQHSSKRKS
jgi:hypothetical protein